MFTGIIEQTGEVINFKNGILSIKSGFTELKIGESISINGVCLTIDSIHKNIFSVNVSKETLRRTNFSQLKIGQKVNLERALTFQSRLGGHIVLGHIDTTVKILKLLPEGNSKLFLFSLPEKYSKYIVEKGSVALDGVSLTVSKLTSGYFSVVIIPYTLQSTTFSERNVGDLVNLEVDILAKYVESVLNRKRSKITFELLKKSGFV